MLPLIIAVPSLAAKAAVGHFPPDNPSNVGYIRVTWRKIESKLFTVLVLFMKII